MNARQLPRIAGWRVDRLQRECKQRQAEVDRCGLAAYQAQQQLDYARHGLLRATEQMRAALRTPLRSDAIDGQLASLRRAEAHCQDLAVAAERAFAALQAADEAAVDTRRRLAQARQRQQALTQVADDLQHDAQRLAAARDETLQDDDLNASHGARR